ncbi:uncharacterized protein LOC133914722 [Phragmites australis]|uniref:uncharacterized protein LOC133914722 n=1 Tax=Phragmites australis TaxID=29695 RepID=UPI002D789617|nr:uncharacterized protein LOC133914722 [Phragmites australis]
MATNDKDVTSSSSVPALDDEYIDWNLLMVEAEEEYEKEKAIANDEVITRAVHEAKLISEAEGKSEAVVNDEAIAHLLAEEVDMGGNFDTDDGEEEEDEEMGGYSDTDDDEEEEEEEEEEMGGDSDMTDDEEEEEDEEMGGDSDMTNDDMRRRRMRRCATTT